jgi:micrococcal nuclease
LKQGNIPTPPSQFGNLFPDHSRGYLILFVIVALIGAYSLIKGDGDDKKDPGLDGSGSPSTVTVNVDRVVDGDTAKVWLNGHQEYVRYIGIDTPESVKPDYPVECYGEEAKQFNRQLLDRSSRVKLVFDRERRDQYGRLLAYVYSGGTLLQAELLERGYATTLEVPPNTAKADQFTELEDEAREAGRGLWTAC